MDKSFLEARARVGVGYIVRIVTQNSLEEINELLNAFYSKDVYSCPTPNEYAYNTAMTLLNYATISQARGKLNDEIVEAIIKYLGNTVEPRDFAKSVALYCDYRNTVAAGIPAKILSAIRTGTHDEKDFSRRLQELPQDKFALMVGYLANSKRLGEVPHSIGKHIVAETHRRQLVPVGHLLPMIAMNMVPPIGANDIGAMMIAMVRSGTEPTKGSKSSPAHDESPTDDEASPAEGNVIPFASGSCN